ncbi:MAG: alkene reductase [Rhodopirellula sp. TMED11]|nr:MAG: alkene reductase [Rhodopirellula sp. TMED11]
MTIHSHLLSTYRLHDLQLDNRAVLAPLTRARSGPERVPNANMAEYYAQRASAGLIISEATVISEQGIGWVDSPGIYTDAMTSGWRSVVRGVHEAGGKIFMQLWHCGRASHSSYHQGELPVAPSAIQSETDYLHTPLGKQRPETPRALELDEIPGLIKDYQKAAKRAQEAGFDGVEIHSANGYLLDTFLQSKTNHRTDQYGGSKANRTRLLTEIVEAVGTIYPANRIGVRLSPNGSFNDMGSPDYREQFLYAAEKLNEYKLCYLHVMDGLGFGFHQLGDAMTLKEFREVFSAPLMGNCGYTQETAEAAIVSGDADLISFGRPFISNPDLIRRFRDSLPLNPEADVRDWYSPTGATGYTDFPFYGDEALAH